MDLTGLISSYQLGDWDMVKCSRCGGSIYRQDYWLRYDGELYHRSCFEMLRDLGLIESPKSVIAESIDWGELEFDFTDNPDPRSMLNRLKLEIEDLELRSRFNVDGKTQTYLYMSVQREPLIEYPTSPLLGEPLLPGQVYRKPIWE